MIGRIETDQLDDGGLAATTEPREVRVTYTVTTYPLRAVMSNKKRQPGFVRLYKSRLLNLTALISTGAPTYAVKLLVLVSQHFIL